MAKSRGHCLRSRSHPGRGTPVSCRKLNIVLRLVLCAMPISIDAVACTKPIKLFGCNSVTPGCGLLHNHQCTANAHRQHPVLRCLITRRGANKASVGVSSPYDTTVVCGVLLLYSHRSQTRSKTTVGCTRQPCHRVRYDISMIWIRVVQGKDGHKNVEKNNRDTVLDKAVPEDGASAVWSPAEAHKRYEL